MALNTNGLSGYALQVANAINSGQTVSQATAAANTSAYGNASGPTNNAQISQALSGSNYSVVPGTTGLITASPAANKASLVPEQPIIEQPKEINPQEYIEQLKAAQRQSRIASLDKAKTSALGSLDTEKANVAPTYYDKRNQAAAASDVGAMNFAQYMAARGIKGAAGAMPEIYRNAGLQGQIGALDQQEASNLANIERQRSNVESGYASDVASANADVEAQAMQAMINQYNADRANRLAEAQLTGSLGDTRTLAGQEFDYSKSSSNPAVQATILANKKYALDIAYQEIINSNATETEKLKVQELKQKVDAGQYDTDIALAQLNQIKAATSKTLSGGSGGGLTAYEIYQIEHNAAKDDSASQDAFNARVDAAAKADPRLENPSLGRYANNTSVFSLAALQDAYRELYKKQALSQ